jgi:hypothetical protein
VEAYVGELIEYPIDVGHNWSEADWVAADPFELLVYLLAHELEHARVYRAVYPNRAKLVVLNHEPRVRAVGYRAMLAFREHRDELLAEWLVAPAHPRGSAFRLPRMPLPPRLTRHPNGPHHPLPR